MGNIGEGGQKDKLPVVKQVSHGNAMQSVVTIVNDIAMLFLKVAKRVNLKSSYHQKNFFVTMHGDRC